MPPSNPPPAPSPSAPPAADQVLPHSHQLDGYQLQGLVAATSSSLTYLATDLELGLAVTVMEYFPAALARRDGAGTVGPAEARDATAFQRGQAAFIEEARVLARCRHPALVQVIRLWHAHGTVYRAMHYREGQTLLELRREMPGPPDEASLLALMDDLLDALDSFHRTGRSHGGIHPGHVLLLSDDRPLLLGPDWAAAALAMELGGHALTEAQTGFAPREQMNSPPGAPQSPSVDLYALSEVVKFCISGELPPPTPTRRLGASGEPVAELLRRCVVQDARIHYGAPLLQTLDAATSGRPQDRPVDVAQYRAWLADGPPSERRLPPTIAAATPAPMRNDANAFLTPEFMAQLRTANEEQAPTPEPPGVVAPPVRERREPALDAQPPSGGPKAPNAPSAAAASRAQPAPARRSATPALLALGLLAAIGVAAWQAGLIQLPEPRPVRELGPLARDSAAGRIETEQARQARAEADLRRAEELLARSAPPPPAIEPDPAAAASAGVPAAPASAPAPAPAPAEAAAPPAVAPENPARPAALPAAARTARTGTPRSACGNRSEFALYRCMQTQCEQARWRSHAQCLALKKGEEID